MIPVLLLLFRRFIAARRKIPAVLFHEALRNENSGAYELALLNYEQALSEMKKRRMQGTSLKIRITEKLKILHTVIAWNKNFQPATNT